jgi:carboxymethylenebutenolidase
MGEMIEFPSNGTNGMGYLAAPGEGGGLPLIVLQEWWGLNDHIKDVADRFAAQGFLALAPDLYGGKTTTEPDEAGKEMMAMDLGRAAKDLSGAVDELIKRSGSGKVGVVGFCMGGGLALWLSCLRGDAITACVPFYGAIPWPDAQPDYSKIRAAVQGHYAENDGWAGPAAVNALEETLRPLGYGVEMHLYQGAEHAFFNDTRPEVYNEDYATAAFHQSVAFLKRHLG